MDLRLDDMRLFASVAAARSFTGAARELHVPKQTLSRRIAELEDALGVQLLIRTTRRVQLTAAGAQYAARCSEVVRLAQDAHRALGDERAQPSGTLRITADPLFGEAFLPPVLHEFASRWPAVSLEVLLTQRTVDLIEESFDVAFRIGRVDDVALRGRALAPARIRFCASPGYLERRGRPRVPQDLASHDCIVIRADLGPASWPLRGERGGVRAMQVAGRYRYNSHRLAHEAALAGLGIGVFAEFACAADVKRRRLIPVLEDWRPDIGHVWLLHPTQRLANPTIQAFVELAATRLSSSLNRVVDFQSAAR